MAELRKKITTETLSEQLSTDKCWEITAKILTALYILRGTNTMPHRLGKVKGFIAPVLGVEKWTEILTKMFRDGAKKMFPWVKETFNIPVEDAIGVDSVATVVSRLEAGPEWEVEYVEKTPERVVCRFFKCPYWKRYEEFEVDPAFVTCDAVHQVWTEEGIKAVNPKIIYKLTKAMPWGDPYCEEVFAFKDE